MPLVPGIVYVQAPSAPVPPPTDPGREHYVIWWEGWDGSNWSLSDEDSGLVMMRGARGFGGISIEHHRDDHANLAGSRWRDFRALNREIFLPIHLFSDGSSRDWVLHNRAFTKTMRAGRTGWLHIIHPDGEHRKIEARYEKGLEEAFELDPAFYGWATYGVYLTAERPYWRAAEPIPRSWDATEPVYFFGAGTTPGNGPPFGLRRKETVGTATITNPGDVEAWPKWTINGPTPGASVGIGDDVVPIPIELLDGEKIVLDTDPEVQLALLYSGETVTDVTSQLGTYDFAEIPAGQSVSLAIALEGTGGSVGVEITPLYEWGLS